MPNSEPDQSGVPASADGKSKSEEVASGAPVDKLAVLLKELKLSKYLDNFQTEEVIFEDLGDLTEEDLAALIPKAIPRRRLVKHLKDARSQKERKSQMDLPSVPAPVFTPASSVSAPPLYQPHGVVPQGLPLGAQPPPNMIPPAASGGWPVAGPKGVYPAHLHQQRQPPPAAVYTGSGNGPLAGEDQKLAPKDYQEMAIKLGITVEQLLQIVNNKGQLPGQLPSAAELEVKEEPALSKGQRAKKGIFGTLVGLGRRLSKSSASRERASGNSSSREVKSKRDAVASALADSTSPSHQQGAPPARQVLIEGLVQNRDLNGVYSLVKGQRECNKVYYRRVAGGPGVLAYQQKDEWKVLVRDEWETQRVCGIWYCSKDFDEDLMVYRASNEDVPYIQPRKFDSPIWEWNEKKNQWLRTESVKISPIFGPLRCEITGLEHHPSYNGTYQMASEATREGERAVYKQISPASKAILHWEKRKNFQVLNEGTWVEPEDGVGLWIVSPKNETNDLRVYFPSNEEHPFMEAHDYDKCRWEWNEEESRFILLTNCKVERVSDEMHMLRSSTETLEISGMNANPLLNGTYVWNGQMSQNKRVYFKQTTGSDAHPFCLSWTKKQSWSVRVNKSWCEPADGVGIWHFATKVKGKILCYFASNEDLPYSPSNEYDQVVWEWKAQEKKWLKVYDWEIKPLPL